MKTLILSCLALAALLSLPACTTVHEPTAHTSTTTTEETIVRRPVGATTETRTVQTY